MGEIILSRIADYCAGILDKEAAQELRCWIEEDPGNKEIFEKYLRMVKMHRMIEGEQLICDQESWDRLYGKLRQQRSRRIVRCVAGVAASVLLILGIGSGIWMKLQGTKEPVEVSQILPGTTKAVLVLANGSQIDLARNDLKEVTDQGALIKNDTSVGLQYDHVNLKIEEPVSHTVKVPVAGEYHFTLPDGTKVWINSESELTFPVVFIGEKREVFLKGEAFFDVEHDEDHPFIVHADKVAIEVLGTQFNVSAYTEQSQVATTLVQGKVIVALGDEKVCLNPGYQAVVAKNSGTVCCSPVEPGMYVSWIHGIFEYENMTLEQIAVQLSRWYDVNFVFAVPEFKERRFTGVIKKYDLLNDVLEIIEKTTAVCFRIHGKEVLVNAPGL